MKPERSRLQAVALGAIILTAVLFGGVSLVSAQDSVEPAVIADIQETGTVDVTVVYTYDLETTAEQEAFDQLKTDDALATDMESRFSDRMTQVANATATRTGRDISVAAVDLTFDSTESTGVVKLTATMTNLASVTDGEIALSQPFSADFRTDRPVIVTAPDGYEITESSPAPDEQDTATVRWSSDRSLDGFTVVAAETQTQSDTTTGSAPGMGIVAGLIALSGAVALRRRG